MRIGEWKLGTGTGLESESESLSVLALVSAFESESVSESVFESAPAFVEVSQPVVVLVFVAELQFVRYSTFSSGKSRDEVVCCCYS